MLPRVREHVDESAAHGAGCRERVAVPAFGEQPAAAKEEPIDSARETHVETANALDEGAVALRFDQKVNMVRLHGKMHDLKAAAVATIRGVDRSAHRREGELRAQRPTEHAQRDMLRNGRAMHRSRPMLHSTIQQASESIADLEWG